MRDIGTRDSFEFNTRPIKYQNIYGSHQHKEFGIYPYWSFEWDYKILSIFLNELRFFGQAISKPTRKVVKKDENYRYFKFFHRGSGINHYVLIEICTDRNFDINVYVSHELLLDKRYFKEIKESQYSYYYKLIIPELRESSLAILNSETFAFFTINDFSASFAYFTKIITKDFINNGFTFFLFHFAKLFYKRSIDRPIINLNYFMSQARGYFKIMTTDKNFKNLFKLNDENSYIIRGCYISPYAQSILKDNFTLIDGIMIDGTFKVLKHYVTCLIVCISFNTSIPIGFTFSPIEDCKLYDSIFKTFLEITEIDISNFIIQSDQGSSLNSICTKYDCKHLICLRHLLDNLQKKKYGFEASKLVSCKCTRDFEVLSGRFNDIFSKLSATEKVKLNTTLNKIGLSFIDDEITITDVDTWDSVSMINRSKYKMPSTTNSIESIHGHLNEATPRNNLFFPSIYR